MIRKVVATDDQGTTAVRPSADHLLSFRCVPNPMGVISETAGFVPQYYPNTADARSAAPIQLKPGAEFVANFALRRARGGVSVTVDGDTKVEGGNGSQLLVGHRRTGRVIGLGGYARARSGHDILPHSTGRTSWWWVMLKSINTLAEWVEVGSQDVTVTLPWPTRRRSRRRFGW